jgi:hypothetical protein
LLWRRESSSQKGSRHLRIQRIACSTQALASDQSSGFDSLSGLGRRKPVGLLSSNQGLSCVYRLNLQANIDTI